MSPPQPYQGHFDGTRHMFAVRVYFEDTDFSGVVYHARYLHFMERARSDMLARVGIDQRVMQEAGQGAYAVTEMKIRYRRPAKFDDALLVISTVEARRLIELSAIITALASGAWCGTPAMSSACS